MIIRVYQWGAFISANGHEYSTSMYFGCQEQQLTQVKFLQEGSITFALHSSVRDRM